MNNQSGFALRLLAALTEFFIFLFIHALFWQYISTSQNLSEVISRLTIYLVILIISPIGLIYNILLTYYAGGTLGKLLTGLKIVGTNNKKLTLKQVMFRQTIGYQFSTLFFGLGYFSILKDPEKRAWHDKSIGSKVIKTQNHWPLAIVAIIAFDLLTVSTINSTLNNFKTSPTRFEIGALTRLYQVQQEITDQEDKTASSSATPLEND